MSEIIAAIILFNLVFNLNSSIYYSCRISLKNAKIKTKSQDFKGQDHYSKVKGQIKVRP